MTQFSTTKIQEFWVVYYGVLQLDEFQNYRDYIKQLSGVIQRTDAVSGPTSAMQSVVNLLQSSTIVEADLKRSIEKAFEVMNRNRRYGRFTKGELYASMFAVGFPLGFIAKLLLNGNLGPIRNAVILHKVVVYKFATDMGGAGMFVAMTLRAIGADARAFKSDEATAIYTILTHLSYKYGGLSLAEKMAFNHDWTAFCDNLIGTITGAATNRLMNVISYNMNGQAAFAAVFYQYGNARRQSGTFTRRGVRRTGLTTSRNAAAVAAGQQLPSTQSVSQTGSTVTSAAVTPAANVTQPTQATRNLTKVRDIPFENTTFGVEFELTPQKDDSTENLINNLISEFGKVGVPVRSMGYTHQVTQGWKIVSDSSIRPFGVEVVSPVLKGKRGLSIVKKAMSAIRAAGASINVSVGTHVHFGAQGLELEQWKNLLYNYAGFEPLINQSLHETRRSSRWCKPISKISNYKEKIERASSFKDLGTKLFGDAAGPNDYARPGGRYHTVNIYSYISQGTVEFRQLQGTTETDTIIYWIMWLHFLFEASKRKKLSFFDYKQVRNITPVWLSTWLGNRSFDLNVDGKNWNTYTG